MALIQRVTALIAALCVSGVLGVAQAADDPASARAEGFCRALLQAAKSGKGASIQQRAARLEPRVADDFNLQVLAPLAVGEPWARMTPAERGALVAELTHYTAARFASELDADTGQRCVVDPKVETRGPDKLVRTKVVDPQDTISLNYRLREYGGAWKIIDVYYNGVSQLTTQRADFAGVVRTQGTAGLIARLKELTAQLR
jgi:phospholipid transport system substrate-binding protein